MWVRAITPIRYLTIMEIVSIKWCVLEVWVRRQIALLLSHVSQRSFSVTTKSIKNWYLWGERGVFCLELTWIISKLTFNVIRKSRYLLIAKLFARIKSNTSTSQIMWFHLKIGWKFFICIRIMGCLPAKLRECLVRNTLL